MIAALEKRVKPSFWITEKKMKMTRILWTEQNWIDSSRRQWKTEDYSVTFKEYFGESNDELN